MLVQKMRYGTSVRLSIPHAQAVARVTTALKDEGFGILTEIDVKGTLKQKLGAEFREYVILGACNPPLAHRALQADLDVGLLLPCNVVVYADGTESVVAIVDPIAMLGTTENAALRPIAEEAKARLARVLQRLEGGQLSRRPFERPRTRTRRMSDGCGKRPEAQQA